MKGEPQTMYLKYKEYEVYCGNSNRLSEASFNEFEFQAESLINWYTFNRLKGEAEIPENVKMCVFSLIKKLVLWNNLKSCGITASSDEETAEASELIKSQSNDGVSVSYNVISASEALANSKKEISDTIKTYLSGIYNSKGQSLTYRGMYPGEETPCLESGAIK